MTDIDIRAVSETKTGQIACFTGVVWHASAHFRIGPPILGEGKFPEMVRGGKMGDGGG